MKLKRTRHNIPKILLLILMLSILTSCHKYQWATITNDSIKNLTLNIKYNSDQRIDTVKLKPGDQYTFDDGNIHDKPTFERIEEIEILANDTLILKTKNIFLDELFSTQEEKGIYELRIE